MSSRSRKIIPYRFEHFGGILHLEHPSSLIWVDKDYMRSIGFEHSPLWDIDRPYLSAPTEVHMAITNRCSAGCVGCYMNAGPNADDDLSADQFRRIIDILADMRVFHLAMGGGESFERDDFLALAGHARSRGIVPNVTTNGHTMDNRLARKCKIFGQINVSIDGIEDVFALCRGHDSFAKADRAVDLLRNAGCRVGINTVVSRRNYDHLEEVIRYAKRKRVLEIELLRFKPSGRGANVFDDFDLTPEQARQFFPMITSLARRYHVWIKLDCSFTPMVCFHEPDPAKMEFFSISGCEAGNLLMGIGANGKPSACSFSELLDLDIFKLDKWWENPQTFAEFRYWNSGSIPEPCAGCKYLSICRGGCHPVAGFIYGNLNMPDPGCPFVEGEITPPQSH